ncbi:MAG: TonB-dependent receptor, partial [Flavobacteriales bacterium]
NNQLFVNPSDPLNPESDFIRTIESFNQFYRFTFSTQFRKWPNLETGYNVNINENPNNSFTTHSPFARLEYVFGKGFTFNGSYTYNNFRSSTGDVRNTFDLLSASLNYRKKDAKMEYRVSGTNLLNTQTVNRDSFNIIGFSSTQEQILPRYLILSLKYNI